MWYLEKGTVRMLNNLTTLVCIVDHLESVHGTDAQAAEIVRKCLDGLIRETQKEQLAHEEKMKGAAGERASWPRVGGTVGFARPHIVPVRLAR